MAKVQLLKPQSLWRWPILALACLMLLGEYYCQDVPAALKQQFKDYFNDPSYYETYFSLLYSIYSIPNVILPFFGGYFVDRFGIRLTLLVFTVLITLGQTVFSVGISVKSWPLLFLGRFIFGLGGENLIVANSALMADWFRGKELAFAFGINLAIARLGSVVNNLVSPALTKSAGVQFACWFGVIICIGSVGCVLLTFPIDRMLDKRQTDLVLLTEEISESSTLKEKSLETGENDSVDKEVVPVVQFRDVLSFTHILWVLGLSCFVIYGCVHPFNNVLSSLLLERNFFMTPPDGCTLTHPNSCQSADNTPLNCPASRWYQPPLPSDLMVDGQFYSGTLTAADIDCTSDVWSGSSGCTEEYCDRLSTGESQASVIMSIPFIISGVVSPFLGLAIDRFGFRAVIATISPGILIIVHSLMGYTRVSPVGPLVGQGIAYTCFAAVLWPAVPLVVEERLIGLAYGVMTSLLNTGSATLPLIVAAIYNDSNDRYIPHVEILFISLASIGFVVGLYLNYFDYSHGNILNRGLQVQDVEKFEDVGDLVIKSPILLKNDSNESDNGCSLHQRSNSNSRSRSREFSGEIMKYASFLADEADSHADTEK